MPTGHGLTAGVDGTVAAASEEPGNVVIDVLRRGVCGGVSADGTASVAAVPAVMLAPLIFHGRQRQLPRRKTCWITGTIGARDGWVCQPFDAAVVRRRDLAGPAGDSANTGTHFVTSARGPGDHRRAGRDHLRAVDGRPGGCSTRILLAVRREARCRNARTDGARGKELVLADPGRLRHGGRPEQRSAVQDGPSGVFDGTARRRSHPRLARGDARFPAPTTPCGAHGPIVPWLGVLTLSSRHVDHGRDGP